MKQKNSQIHSHVEFESLAQEAPASLVESLLDRASKVFVKKLTQNDRGWSWTPRKGKQGGPYIPVKQRDSGFFPELSSRKLESGEFVREADIETLWPQVNEKRESHLVNYRSKKEETHFTRVPKGAFQNLSPASFLMIGLVDGNYECITIDSLSDDAQLLREELSLGVDFTCDILIPSEKRTTRQKKQLSFLEEILIVFRENRFEAYRKRFSDIPSPAEFAAMARAKFLNQEGLIDLNPFEILKPGDAIRCISREIEWEIFKEFQFKSKALDLLQIVVGNEWQGLSAEKVVTSLVNDYSK